MKDKQIKDKWTAFQDFKQLPARPSRPEDTTDLLNCAIFTRPLSCSPSIPLFFSHSVLLSRNLCSSFDSSLYPSLFLFFKQRLEAICWVIFLFNLFCFKGLYIFFLIYMGEAFFVFLSKTKSYFHL